MGINEGGYWADLMAAGGKTKQKLLITTSKHCWFFSNTLPVESVMYM
jgi:hypothetical protein